MNVTSKSRTATPLNEDDRVIEFAAASQRFCRFVDRRSRLDRRAFVHQAGESLTELQLRALRVVRVRTKLVPYIARPEQAPAEHARRWKHLYNGLRRKVGKQDGYWSVFNPYKSDEPIFTSLADDLADIYLDLQEGLRLYKSAHEHAVHDAVWHWKSRWLLQTGHHCVSALRPLQVLVEEYYGIVHG